MSPLGPYAPRRRPVPVADPDSVDLRALLRALWRRKVVIAAMTLLGALLAFAAVSRIDPTYTAIAKVMLDARKAQVVSGAEVVGDLDLRDEVVNGEVAVLRSNVLIERVIEDLGLERLGPALDPSGAEIGEPSGPFEGMTADELRSERLVFIIRRLSSVWREGDSYVIGIKAVTGDPVLSAELANGIAAAYIDSQLESRLSFAQGATNWIEARVGVLRDQLEEAEAAVEEYRAGGFLSGGESGESATGQLAQLNEQLAVARADRVSAEARLSRMNELMERDGPAGMSGIVTSGLIDTLNAERIALERRDAEWASRYDADHPERTKIAAALARVDGDLRVEIESRMNAARSEVEIARLRERSMQESIDALEARLIELSRSGIGLRQLEREADAARAAYEELLSRLSETRTQEQLQQPDAKLIERATVPGGPSAPRPKLMIAVGGIVGMMGGLAWVLFGELTALGFSSVARLEGDTGLPVLAAIPAGRWRRPKAAFDALRKEQRGAFAERVRQLRTAILAQDGRSAPRSVMLVSSIPDEGKTTTVIALAQMAAAAGRSVVVVDCDLRRASIGQAFPHKGEHDFASFVADECGLGEAIRYDEALGFDILAPRKPVPDLADQLSADWLKPMFEALKASYDLVIVDAPALLSVADGLVIGRSVDSRVYLVKAVSTPRGAVTKGLNLLDENGLPVLGLVMTMVDPRTVADSYQDAYAAYA